MLIKFRPLYAPDGDGGAAPEAGGAAAVVDQIVNGGAQPGPDEIDADIDLGLDAGGEGGDADDWEDVDLDDMKVRAPKGKAQAIRDGYLRMGDYTKKTQAVAERERAFEAREKQSEVARTYDGQINKGIWHLEEMDKAIQSEYEYFNSPQYQQDQLDDFQKADGRWKQYQLNQQLRAKLAGSLGVLVNERNSKLAEAQKAAEAETSKRREQLPREIAKLVPGWNADMAAKVEDFAVRELGYEPEALKSSTEPRHFQTLHLAMLGRMYLDAKARKGSGAVIPKGAAPTKTVASRGGPSSGSPSDKDDIGSWMEKERAREAAKRKARA